MKRLLSAVLALLLSVGTVEAALAYGGLLSGSTVSTQDRSKESNAP